MVCTRVRILKVEKNPSGTPDHFRWRVSIPYIAWMSGTRSNGTFQYLTGLPNFPDPQTLARFLHQAPDSFREQMNGVNNRLLQTSSEDGWGAEDVFAS